MSDADKARLPGLAQILDYLDAGVSGSFQVPGDPQAVIVVDPQRNAIGFRVPSDGSLPDTAKYANVRVRTLEDAGVIWSELALLTESNTAEAYHLVCAALNRVQVDGDTFAAAVGLAVEGVADLIELRPGLSEERRIGLFGELLTLIAITRTNPGLDAVGAWRGASSEEHDFGLAAADVEVKTTVSEARRHWISSRTQLEPTPGRPLHLLSVQITAAPVGTGWTLPELVAQATKDCHASADALHVALNEYGYRHEDADLYRRRWIPRSSPQSYLVDGAFPAVTPDRLSAAVPNHQRVLEIRYLLDVEGLPQTDLGINFASILAKTKDQP